MKLLKEDFQSKRKDKKEMANNWKEQTKKKRKLKKRFKAQKEELVALAKQKEDKDNNIKELERQLKQLEEKGKTTPPARSPEQDLRSKLQGMERENAALLSKNKELTLEIAYLKKGASSDTTSREKDGDKVWIGLSSKSAA